MKPRFVAAAILATANALRQTNAARLTLFGDGCGFRAARLDERMRGHPAVVAAARRGRLDPTLRFMREVLGVEDATDLIEATPQLASTPLAVTALARASGLSKARNSSLSPWSTKKSRGQPRARSSRLAS